MTNRALLRITTIGVILALSAGCSSVKPWQRDVMARQSMAANKQPMIASFDDHLYFSKEASTGGKTLDGGGCGCN